MDMDAVAGMLFVLLLAALVGGFVLLFPLSRRLGKLMEERIGGQKQPPQLADEDVRELRSAVQALQAQLEQLAERQEFTESLLAERPPLQLPRSED